MVVITKEEILSGLPENVRKKASVTMEYQTYLQAINGHLQTLYGEYANWTKCIENYFVSDEYNSNCHFVQNCDDIPELSRGDLGMMLREEEKYSANIKELLAKRELLNSKNDNCEDVLYSVLNILGIHPDAKDDSLFKWLINRKYINTHQYIEIREKFDNNRNLTYLVADIMSSLFLNGFILEFPQVGGVMTQQKGKYYYRGENAFYASSKPSLYRGKTNDKIPQYIQELIEILRRDECWNFLDQFDAVKHWSASSINYLAISQHYGLRTQMMDLTSNLKTALFFACCKYGTDKKWRPLKNEEIKYKDSRQYISSIGGDSRYGIIYRCPTEINDMKWAVSDRNMGFNIITPIGYQPFMRCSHQYGYMMLTNSKDYDMMQDPLFDKFKIRLDEELCAWIYEEMGRGDAIYPHDDIPDIAQYIEAMNNQHIFSENVFKTVVKEFDIGINGEKKIRQVLKTYGYSICPNISYFSCNKLNKINKKYTAEVAYSKIEADSLARPILILPTDVSF